jgi:hypothetical protein
MHRLTRQIPPPARRPRTQALLALLASTFLVGCGSEEDVRAVMAETEAFCAAHPVPALPARVQSSRIYIGPGALTRSWLYWIPERLLQKGFAEVESAASIAPYISGQGEYLRFRIAAATEPGCSGQQALATHLGPAEWPRIQRHLVDLGLRPDQCLSIERTPERKSPYWIEGWDVSSALPDRHEGLPIERKRVRFVATDARSRRVVHEHFAEYGFVNTSFATPFGCMRREDQDRLTDEWVQGERAGDTRGATTVPAAGPETIEQPPSVPVQPSTVTIEWTKDLGNVTIPGLELSQRRQRSTTGGVTGFEILEGESNNPSETNPKWPRYLQMSADGAYRRIRLAWLEGEPHGMHDRPVRLYDLGDRIGLFAVTRRLRPETRGAFDLSWAELSRDTGLPLRRVDGVMPLAADADTGFQSLIEDVQFSNDGVGFTLTEVGVQRDPGVGSDFVLRRETRYRWSFE